MNSLYRKSSPGTRESMALLEKAGVASTMDLMKACAIQNPAVLLHCAILQMLDVVSTLLFLAHGVAEANPLVKWSIATTHGNLAGLLAIKSFACVLAVLAVQSGRTRVVVKMNRFFTLLVGWNLFALALSFA